MPERIGHFMPELSCCCFKHKMSVADNLCLKHFVKALVFLESEARGHFMLKGISHLLSIKCPKNGVRELLRDRQIVFR